MVEKYEEDEKKGGNLEEKRMRGKTRENLN
jgi:hypothetical protein